MGHNVIHCYLKSIFNWESGILSGTQTPAHPELSPPLAPSEGGRRPFWFSECTQSTLDVYL